MIRVTISGPQGAGKTQLALELHNALLKKYREVNFEEAGFFSEAAVISLETTNTVVEVPVDVG